MGGFSHAPFFAAAALNGLNFLTGCFLCRSRTKANAGRYAGRLSTRSLRSGGPGHDCRRRPDGGLLHHATCRTGAGRALGHFRRGSLSLGRDHDRHFACRIWHSAFTAQAMITGPVAAWLGERRALMLGMIADGTGYILLAFATRGWMAFLIMVLLASVASECRRCKQCCPGRWMRNVRGSCKAHWRRSPA